MQSAIPYSVSEIVFVLLLRVSTFYAEETAPDHLWWIFSIESEATCGDFRVARLVGFEQKCTPSFVSKTLLSRYQNSPHSGYKCLCDSGPSIRGETFPDHIRVAGVLLEVFSENKSFPLGLISRWLQNYV